MLEDIRKKIDKIDDEIVALYGERMQCAREVAEEKSKNNLVVTHSTREKEIVNRVVKQVAPELQLYTKQLFQTLFDTSKAYQSRFLNLKAPVTEGIVAALSASKPFAQNATVACQGIEGAYSNLAADKLFPLSEITYFKSFENVFNAVDRGLCRYGVLPIENSTAGSVKAVYDLMKQYKFHIVRSVKLKIRHHMIAAKGTKIQEITTIYSHQQALQQCEKFIDGLKNVRTVECENTAAAARFVMQSSEKGIACIASKECADIYGLSVVKSNVQDADNNFTRFICIAKDLEITPDANKISIMLCLPHEPGNLNGVLNRFSALGLNLTKLESRPLPNTDFDFMFYFDFDADIKNNETQNLLAELEKNSEQFTLLGSYHEV